MRRWDFRSAAAVDRIQRSHGQGKDDAVRTNDCGSVSLGSRLKSRLDAFREGIGCQIPLVQISVLVVCVDRFCSRRNCSRVNAPFCARVQHAAFLIKCGRKHLPDNCHNGDRRAFRILHCQRRIEQSQKLLPFASFHVGVIVKLLKNEIGRRARVAGNKSD